MNLLEHLAQVLRLAPQLDRRLAGVEALCSASFAAELVMLESSSRSESGAALGAFAVSMTVVFACY